MELKNKTWKIIKIKRIQKQIQKLTKITQQVINR